jgi:alpha-beta hydrolase superfamily lysophospholipase
MTTLIFPGTAAQYRRALACQRGRSFAVIRSLYGRAVLLTAVVLPVVAIVLLGVALLRPEPAGIERFELPPLRAGIAFDTAAEARRTRTRLLRYVFGASRLPRGLPAVERDIADPVFTSVLPNLARVDRLTVSMPLGFRSVVYHAVPRRRANGALVVYHGGHEHGLDAGKSTITHLLDRGYAVLVLAMPLAGLNTSPEYADTPCGRVRIEDGGDYRNHNRLACVPFAFRYFVEPVAVALNYAERFDYRLTAMVGLSGGGWTTAVYAALDPRVQRSYPVAGSQPHHVTARLCPDDDAVALTKCFSDFEQRDAGFYRIANYPELYALAGWGRGRKQLAVHNVYDPCCFGGRVYREWTPSVQATLRRLGSGAYAAVGDTTHRDHAVSLFAAGVIVNDLEAALREASP